MIFSPNKRFRRSVVDVEPVANNVSRFLSVFIRSKAFFMRFKRSKGVLIFCRAQLCAEEILA